MIRLHTVRVLVVRALLFGTACLAVLADDIIAEDHDIYHVNNQGSDDTVTTVTEDPISIGDGPVFCTTTQEGYFFDLSDLYTTIDYTANGQANFWKYSLNICGPSNEGKNTACGPKGGAICQYKIEDGLETAMIAKWEDPVYQTLAPNDPSQGLMVTFKNGDPCSASYPTRLVYLKLKCKQGEKGKIDGLVSENANICSYTINFLTEVTCPGYTPQPSSNTGLSGGWIFIICLIVTLFLYIFIGCFYKRKRLGLSGREACPNIDFWSQLPGLVKDGFLYTKRRLFALSSRSDYEKL